MRLTFSVLIPPLISHQLNQSSPKSSPSSSEAINNAADDADSSKVSDSKVSGTTDAAATQHKKAVEAYQNVSN